MMRRNIFDIAKGNISLESELDRINTLSTDISTICYYGRNRMDLFQFVRLYCFKNWKNRGHFLDLDDFLDTIEFGEAASDATYNSESLFIYLEVIYNMWQIAYRNKLDKPEAIDFSKDYFLLKEIIDSILAQYNHYAYIDENAEQVLIIESKPEATAVAEIISPELALPVIRYNHHALKGDIDAKKSILRTLGDHLEPQRKDLEALDKQLSQDIFFMLNSMNIRHNNITPGDKNYKEFVTGMKPAQLEEWYDELYQMILLANLLLDNRERTQKVKVLKANINNQQKILNSQTV